jgi:murein DD-endopeptidase MepM/ murein hydrolase activator NlpD
MIISARILYLFIFMRRRLSKLIILTLLMTTTKGPWASGATLQPPTNCTTIDSGTQGRVLVIEGKLSELNSAERNILSQMADNGSDGDANFKVKVASFRPQIHKFALNASLASQNSFLQYMSLKNFILKQKFLKPAVLSINTDNDILSQVLKNSFTGWASEIKKNYSNVNLNSLLPELKNEGSGFPLIKSGKLFTWISNGELEDEALFIQIVDNDRNMTLIFSIAFQSQSKNCVSSDSEEFNEIKPVPRPEIFKDIHRPFQMPVQHEIYFSDFFGPRIYGASYNVVQSLQKQDSQNPQSPVFINPSPQNPISYLRTNWKFHKGIDIAVPFGTPVYASQDGRVVLRGPVDCIGFALELEHNVHGKQIFSGYLHLQGFNKVVESANGEIRILNPGERYRPAQGETVRLIQSGDQVKQGDLIGFSGNGSINGRKDGSKQKSHVVKGERRGCNLGEHLHYEMRLPKSEKIQVEGVTAQQSYYYLNSHADFVNPTDYISYIDQNCRQEKIHEFNNWVYIQKHFRAPLPLGPITAWGCSAEYEKEIRLELREDQLPFVYRSNDIETILKLWGS